MNDQTLSPILEAQDLTKRYSAVIAGCVGDVRLRRLSAAP
jgi:hypothetical protein